MDYWLMKSEPDAYSIDDLKKERVDHWDGIRNYQARNFMQEMKKGDLILFYHSSCPEPGVVGVASVARKAYPDHTQFDPDGKHYDPKSDPDDPRWWMVDVRYKRKLKRTIGLKELKEQRRLEGMRLLQRGNRLSIMPVNKNEFDFILSLE
ncbi:MAG: EVE domain-containing protein [Gammaproteobacteria bacterium]|nr:MAG: EVE domain-containing protein [Gammaproteobacteria bacterium]